MIAGNNVTAGFGKVLDADKFRREIDPVGEFNEIKRNPVDHKKNRCVLARSETTKQSLIDEIAAPFGLAMTQYIKLQHVL